MVLIKQVRNPIVILAQITHLLAQPRPIPVAPQTVPQANTARVPLVTNSVSATNGGALVPIAPKQQFAGKENKINAQEANVHEGNNCSLL
mgnify:CR=1 FL=1